MTRSKEGILADRSIRRCSDHERGAILEIINAAAGAYRGAVSAELLREPYMATRELDSEIAAGVEFWGFEAEGALVGVMGIQRLSELDLIRHAYVHPRAQRHGVGHALLVGLMSFTDRQMLVGTWAAASWAICFYQQHGFELVTQDRASMLMATHWGIPPRQIEASVVLANPPLRAVP
jgi:N-acetylglutamate synthase-like GNAT family acetyltransferase